MEHETIKPGLKLDPVERLGSRNNQRDGNRHRNQHPPEHAALHEYHRAEHAEQERRSQHVVAETRDPHPSRHGIDERRDVRAHSEPKRQEEEERTTEESNQGLCSRTGNRKTVKISSKPTATVNSRPIDAVPA